MFVCIRKESKTVYNVSKIPNPVPESMRGPGFIGIFTKSRKRDFSGPGLENSAGFGTGTGSRASLLWGCRKFYWYDSKSPILLGTVSKALVCCHKIINRWNTILIEKQISCWTNNRQIFRWSNLFSGTNSKSWANWTKWSESKESKKRFKGFCWNGNWSQSKLNQTSRWLCSWRWCVKKWWDHDQIWERFVKKLFVNNTSNWKTQAETYYDADELDVVLNAILLNDQKLFLLKNTKLSYLENMFTKFQI